MLHATKVHKHVRGVGFNMEHERESTIRLEIEPFPMWLRDWCTHLPKAAGNEQVELKAL